MQSVNRFIDKSKNSRRGFTLIEMLVVIGIIAILVGASLASFSKMAKTADKTKAQELVSQAATALAAIYEADGMWPKSIREVNKDEEKGVLGGYEADKTSVALILANRGYMAMSKKDGKLVGRDRFGILTPWAAKKLESSKNPDSEYVNANALHFAVDLDGDGVITAEECGSRIKKVVAAKGTEKPVKAVRATAVVWCQSKDGKDQMQSWTNGQTTEAE